MCLTRAEAIAAADSALKGMAAVKMLPEQKRMVVDLAIAARAMEGAYHGCDSTRSILVKDAATVMAENEANKRAVEYWKERRKAGRNTWRGITMALAASLAAVVILNK